MLRVEKRGLTAKATSAQSTHNNVLGFGTGDEIVEDERSTPIKSPAVDVASNWSVTISPALTLTTLENVAGDAQV